jgi:hypothetical protein
MESLQAQREEAARLSNRLAEARRRAMAGEGDRAEILAELLWLFDTGMKQVPAMAGVRASFLLAEIQRLGNNYPPAVEALRRRQAAAQADLSSRESWSDFASLCWSFREYPLLLEMYDKARASGACTPPARSLFGAFLGAGRYAEAAAARPLDLFLQEFEQRVLLPIDAAPPGLNARSLAGITADGLEAYAGSGDLDSANAVLDRMLAFARTDEIVGILRERAARAGHPELVDRALERANRQ